MTEQQEDEISELTKPVHLDGQFSISYQFIFALIGFFCALFFVFFYFCT